MDEYDEVLVKYASLISRMETTEHVDFLYITRSIDVPDSIQQEFPDLNDTVDEVAQKHLDDLVETHFHGPETAHIYKNVVEGKDLDELLKRVPQHHIDLIIMRTRQDENESLLIAQKLVRKAPCSILVVPEKTELDVHSILVPIDFSDYSQNATEVALKCMKSCKLQKVFATHIYNVPTGYHKTGKTYEEFAEIMEQNARKDYEDFEILFEDFPCQPEARFVLEKNLVKGIIAGLEETGANMIMIGSRGRSASSALLFGSLTETLLDEIDIPLLAVKEKSSGLSFFEALLEY